MLIAIGMGVVKNPNNTITVKVSVQDDTGKPIATTTFTGASLVDVRGQILADLCGRRDAATDAELQAAVVGVELGSV